MQWADGVGGQGLMQPPSGWRGWVVEALLTGWLMAPAGGQGGKGGWWNGALLTCHSCPFGSW